MKDKFFLNIEILNDKLLKFKIKYLYTSGHMWSQCGHMWSQYGHSVVTVWSPVRLTIFFVVTESVVTESWSLCQFPLNIMVKQILAHNSILIFLLS